MAAITSRTSAPGRATAPPSVSPSGDRGMRSSSVSEANAEDDDRSPQRRHATQPARRPLGDGVGTERALRLTVAVRAFVGRWPRERGGSRTHRAHDGVWSPRTASVTHATPTTVDADGGQQEHRPQPRHTFGPLRPPRVVAPRPERQVRRERANATGERAVGRWVRARVRSARAAEAPATVSAAAPEPKTMARAADPTARATGASRRAAR